MSGLPFRPSAHTLRLVRSRDPLADPERLIRRVYAYVAYRIGDGPDAEDVTSETLERALRYRHTYDAAKGDPAAWVLGIARRCLQDALATRQDALADAGGARAAVDFEEQTIERLVLSAAIAELDERDRDLIALRYGADLTARQIADLVGSRTNAVEVALSRARARLSASLERAGARADANGETRKGLEVGGGTRGQKLMRESQEAT